MSVWKDEDLEVFYQEADFDSDHEEVKEIKSSVCSLVEELADFIASEDSLFENSVIPSGSFFEDLKVQGPDEFDFMICLEDLSTDPGVCKKTEIPSRTVRDPGYIALEVTSEAHQRKWQRYISEPGHLLKPDELLQTFEKLVEKAVKERKRNVLVNIGPEITVELRKIPVVLKITWNGSKYRNFAIAIDLTLCIRMSGWPEASDIRSRVKREHPGYEVVQEAIRGGHHLVASTISESGRPKPCWRLSFSVAEGIVLREICKDPKLIHKMTLKLLKVLRKKNEDYLCLFERGSIQEQSSYVHTIPWEFHSYALKTMFLQEWFEYPQDSCWSKDNLRKRLRGILQRIKNSMMQKDIHSFWVPEYKLFNFQARNTVSIDFPVLKLSTLIKKLREVEEPPRTRSDILLETISLMTDQIRESIKANP